MASGEIAKVAEPVLGLIKQLFGDQVGHLRDFDGYSKAASLLGRLLASAAPAGRLSDVPLDVARIDAEPEYVRQILEEASAARLRASSRSVSGTARYGEAVRRAADLTDGWLRIAIGSAEHVLARGANQPYAVPGDTAVPPARLYGIAVRNATEMLDVLGGELRHQLRWGLLPAFLERRRARQVVINQLRRAEQRLQESERRFTAFQGKALQRLEVLGRDLDDAIAAQSATQEHAVAQAEEDLDRARSEYERLMADASVEPDEKKFHARILLGEVQFQEEVLAMERKLLEDLNSPGSRR